MQRTLPSADLKPPQVEVWVNSQDTDFEAKMTDIVGLYLNPPDGEVMGKCYDRHRHQEFLDLLKIIENHFPNKELVDSIMKFIKQYNKEAKLFRWT